MTETITATAGVPPGDGQKIVAVIVTFNRRVLLRQCLDAVLSQTRKPDLVVVVNNASADGTFEVLESEYADRVHRIHMEKNVGGAGGFYRGMKWGYDQGADWLWLMDDDGVPAKDGLAIMMQPEYTSALALMNPLVVSLDDPMDLSFGITVNGIFTKSVDLIRKEMKGGTIIEGEINPFNGTLIRRDLVTKIGYPKQEMFVWGDEVDYTNRVTKNGFALGTVLPSTHRHPGGSNSNVKKIELGVFGTLDIIDPRRIGLAARNMAYLYREKGAVKLFVFKPIVVSLYYITHGKFRNFYVFIRYYLDGFFNLYRLPPSRKNLVADSERFELRPAVHSQPSLSSASEPANV